MARYNLIDEHWIPALGAEGPTEVSIADCLYGAAEIVSLSAANPLETCAILRQVLLPIVMRSQGVPHTDDEWAELFDRGSFDDVALSRYLEEWKDSFDLFDAGHPFAQAVGLRTEKGETKPSSLLVASAPSGNNVPLFAARHDGNPLPLTPQLAARSLLAAQCFDVAGIKTGAVGDEKVRAGKTTGNRTGAAGELGLTIPLGRNLFETLMLNLPVVADGLSGADLPQWERPPMTAEWEVRPALGRLDLLTWQSRRIRLVPETSEDGVTTVSRVVLCAGDRMTRLPDYEPHTAWRAVKNPSGDQPPNRPIQNIAARTLWRALAPLLATTTNQQAQDDESAPGQLSQVAKLAQRGYLSESFPLQVLTCTVEYGSQNAVIENIATGLIPLPIAALKGDSPVLHLLRDMIRQAEGLRGAANRLDDELRRACGGDPTPWDKGQRIGEVLVHSLTRLLRWTFTQLQHEPDALAEIADGWRERAQDAALDVAEPILNLLPARAFLGRRVERGGAKQSWSRASIAEFFYRRSVREVLGIESIDNEKGEAS